MKLAIYIVDWVFLGMVLFCFAYQGYYFLLIWLKRKKTAPCAGGVPQDGCPGSGKGRRGRDCSAA
ncbi:MAG: hypothetical protein LUE92_03375 [Clostridiales bacterium]|nr:hypothetical protein [Clostridiales bacterium]